MTLVIDSLINRFAALLPPTMIVAMASQLAFAQELPRNFVVHAAPKMVTAISFKDGQGRDRSLADFKGKIVLLNIWATWCASCRYEMPSFDVLQATLGVSDFEVVPLSIDRSGIDAVTKFYTEKGVRSLATYTDTSGKALRDLGTLGLPTTLVIDRTGQEIARVVGPVEWDAPEVAGFLRSTIAKQNDTADVARDAPVPPTAINRDWRGSLMRGFQWLKTLFTR